MAESRQDNTDSGGAGAPEAADGTGTDGYRPYDSGTFFAPAVTAADDRRRAAPTSPSDTDHHIAILCEPSLEHPDASPFFSRAAYALFAFFAKEHTACRLYQGLTFPGRKSPACPTNPRFMENVESGLVSGVLVLTATPSPHWMLPLQRHGVPLVGDAASFESGVKVDYGDMVSRGLGYLAACGCTRPTLFALDHMATERALDKQFMEQARQLRMEPQAPCLVEALRLAGPGSLAAQFIRLWQDPLTRPDGVLILDDMLCKEFLPALPELGIRLGEGGLHVVTHANSGDPLFSKLPVARLELNVEQYAEALGRILLNRIRRRQVAPTIVTLKLQLVEPAPVTKPE